MRIGIQLHPQHTTYDRLREAVMEAEERGADAIYNWDHFYPLYGEPDGSHYEAWTMLGSWAEVTERARIGCLVTCNSYRNPNLLADMARTVDQMSGGRTVLGIGSGWFERDYDEYGYEFGTAGGRLDALAESLPIIKDRLSKLNPGPAGSLPILIGGGGEKKTLRLVAQHADIWHFFWGPEWSKKNDILNQWCEKEGRDPASIERSVGIDTDQVDDLHSILDTLVEAGVDEITIGRGGPDYELETLSELVEWRNSLG